MGYHHLALACRDIQAVHHFYEDIMGFELVKVEIGPVPEGGWAMYPGGKLENVIAQHEGGVVAFQPVARRVADA